MNDSLFSDDPAGAWAYEFITSTSLTRKKNADDCPLQAGATPEHITELLKPGRPVELEVTLEKPKTIKLGALQNLRTRALLIHKFWHHELQAAELMCWAYLKFVDAPPEFRRGLLKIVKDEVRHMGLYEEYLQGLGYQIGDFPVRDWFWERIPQAQTPKQYVALMGMGLEGANLEHTDRFARRFRTLGDIKGAEIQEQVGREEIAHVRFAVRYFKEFNGSVQFEDWVKALPPPLSPWMMKGKTLNRPPRLKAEMPPEFLNALEEYRP